MKTAILSDIHANREALAACLRDAMQRGAERLVFLGDIVGYGADPGWCVDTVAAKVSQGAVCVRGNHDEAVANPDTGMNADALRAIDWTRTQLDEAQKRFLAGLPYRGDALPDVLFVHANGWAPEDWGYVLTEVDAERSLRATSQRLTFCGHTHVPALYAMAPQKPPMAFEPQAGKSVPLVASRRWLAVVGSVGQPRDGHPAASYGWFEPSSATFTLLRVPYDVETAARKVREAGLPESLSARLLRGR